MRVLIVMMVSLVCLACYRAEREEEKHGSPSGKFRTAHEGPQGHDAHLDHQAILGSKKQASAFDELRPEESKRRLAVIARRMDLNGDEHVDRDELIAWIHKSMLSLDKEETDERFSDVDIDRDGFVTWKEYVQDSFGDGDEVDQISQDPEDVRLMAEDEKYFAVADLNRDGKLSAEEFAGFQNPEHYEHMHDMLMKTTLEEKDTNKDGKIDLKEFLGDVAENPSSDWYHSEKERFMNEYDANKDGFLEGEELRAWLIPNTRQTAEDEANHLITQADSNGDGRLSIEEIVAEHQLFVGSEVTNYGDMLQHTEL